MKAYWKVVSTAIVLLILTGCAKTHLLLHLDLYKEDPYSETPLTEGQIARILDGLNKVEAETGVITKARIELADDLTATYESLFFLATKSVRPYSEQDLSRDMKTLNEYLKEYKQKVVLKSEETKKLLDAARSKLDVYLKSSPNKAAESTGGPEGGKPGTYAKVQKQDILDSVRKVYRSFIELGGSLGTDFEKSLVGNWAVVAKSASEENLAKLFKEGKEPTLFSDIRLRISQLSETMGNLRAHGFTISKQLSEQLDEIVRTGLQPGAMKKTVDTIAKAATAIPTSIGLGDRGASAIQDLVLSTTLLYSQIDRLQDPADPILRVISAPENESKWNTEFSETYFFARGNSSIVAVRDTPTSFRVQRGVNNPTALIQGQLQVSRAIGNAAISIAGAAAGMATGIPIPKIAGKGQAEPSIEPTEESSEAEKLAQRKAKVEQKSRIRVQAARNLRQNLISVKEDFQKMDPAKDAQQFKDMMLRLEAILEAHKSVFKNMSSIGSP